MPATKRVVFNQKGGVGKTSITCNLAAAFAREGQRTLVVDLDPQTNASHYLLTQSGCEDAKATITDFFENSLKLKLIHESLRKAVCETSFPNLWVIPASPALGELQAKLENRYKIYKLSQALDEVIGIFRFDQILIDTPPAVNFYSMSALLAADSVLVPFDGDVFAAQALDRVMDLVDEVADDHRPKLHIEGVIVNQFQAQARLPRGAISALVERQLPILEPYLSSSVIMKESHQAGVPLVHFRPKHKLSLEFLALARSLLKATQTKRDLISDSNSSNQRARSKSLRS